MTIKNVVNKLNIVIVKNVNKLNIGIVKAPQTWLLVIFLVIDFPSIYLASFAIS